MDNVKYFDTGGIHKYESVHDERHEEEPSLEDIVSSMKLHILRENTPNDMGPQEIRLASPQFSHSTTNSNVNSIPLQNGRHKKAPVPSGNTRMDKSSSFRNEHQPLNRKMLEEFQRDSRHQDSFYDNISSHRNFRTNKENDKSEDEEYEIDNQTPRLSTPFYAELKKKYPGAFRRRLGSDTSSVYSMPVSNSRRHAQQHTKHEKNSQTSTGRGDFVHSDPREIKKPQRRHHVEFKEQNHRGLNRALSRSESNVSLKERFRQNQEEFKSIFSARESPFKKLNSRHNVSLQDLNHEGERSPLSDINGASQDSTRMNGNVLYMKPPRHTNTNTPHPKTHKRPMGEHLEKKQLRNKRFASPESSHDSAVDMDYTSQHSDMSRYRNRLKNSRNSEWNNMEEEVDYDVRQSRPPSVPPLQLYDERLTSPRSRDSDQDSGVAHAMKNGRRERHYSGSSEDSDLDLDNVLLKTDSTKKMLPSYKSSLGPREAQQGVLNSHSSRAANSPFKADHNIALASPRGTFEESSTPRQRYNESPRHKTQGPRSVTSESPRRSPRQRPPRPSSVTSELNYSHGSRVHFEDESGHRGLRSHHRTSSQPNLETNIKPATRKVNGNVDVKSRNGNGDQYQKLQHSVSEININQRVYPKGSKIARPPQSEVFVETKRAGSPSDVSGKSERMNIEDNMEIHRASPVIVVPERFHSPRTTPAHQDAASVAQYTDPLLEELCRQEPTKKSNKFWKKHKGKYNPGEEIVRQQPTPTPVAPIRKKKLLRKASQSTPDLNQGEKVNIQNTTEKNSNQNIDIDSKKPTDRQSVKSRVDKHYEDVEIEPADSGYQDIPKSDQNINIYSKKPNERQSVKSKVNKHYEDVEIEPVDSGYQEIPVASTSSAPGPAPVKKEIVLKDSPYEEVEFKSEDKPTKGGYSSVDEVRRNTTKKQQDQSQEEANPKEKEVYAQVDFSKKTTPKPPQSEILEDESDEESDNEKDGPTLPRRGYKSNLERSKDLSGSRTSLSEKMDSFKKSARNKFSQLRRAISLERVDKSEQDDQNTTGDKPKLKKSPSLRSLTEKMGFKKKPKRETPRHPHNPNAKKPPLPSGAHSRNTTNAVEDPTHFRPIGKLKQLNPDGTRIIELVKPAHGPFGFYIARGNAKFNHAVLVSRLSDGLPERFFAGLLGLGDEILEINENDVHDMSLEEVYDLMAEQDKLTLKTLPYMVRRDI